MKCILDLLFMLGAATAVFGNHVEVFPKPQNIKIHDETFNIDHITIVADSNVDPDAQKSLKTFLGDEGVGGTQVRMIEGLFSSEDKLCRSGAYHLKVTHGKIEIRAADPAGSFYAVQTLRQLVKGKQIQCAEVFDYPDVEFRGVVEGFYGQPWSHEARLSQFRFYGENKLNTYVYGPKNDPFHGFSNRWRDPYPVEKAKEIAELAKVARENKVNFVWAVHPGRDIHWTQADVDSCIEKFEMMYVLGVRSYAVFFDDIGGIGGRGEKQTPFLNELNRRFIRQKPDVTPLMMCPTHYNRGRALKGQPGYLDILGTELDTDIKIMWTGEAAVCRIQAECLEWAEKPMKRKPFIWWNYPVTDYIWHRLLIGRVEGIDVNAGHAMSGFTANPMDKPEASKIALFSVADYAWNMKGFDSSNAWKVGIRRLFPECADAVQVLANHNSDPGEEVQQFRHEESVEAAPVLHRFYQQYQKDPSGVSSAEITAVMNEMQKMKTASGVIREKCQNKTFVREVGGWLNVLESLGTAGEYAVTAAVIPADKKEEIVFLNPFTSAIAAMNRSGQLRGGPKSASKEVTPFITGLLRSLAEKHYGIKPTEKPSVSCTVPLWTACQVASSPKTISINRIVDVVPFEKDQSVGVRLTDPLCKDFIRSINVSFLNKKYPGMVLEVKTENAAWIRYDDCALTQQFGEIRVRNTADTAYEIAMEKFEIQLNTEKMFTPLKTLTDGDVLSAFHLKNEKITVPIAKDMKKVLILGDVKALKSVQHPSMMSGDYFTILNIVDNQGVLHLENSNPKSGIFINEVIFLKE